MLFAVRGWNQQAGHGGRTNANQGPPRTASCFNLFLIPTRFRSQPKACHRDSEPPMSPIAADDPLHQPFVYRSGETEALLIHGYMGTPLEMRALGKALSGVGITARGLALPGFGADIDRLGQVGAKEWLDAAMRAWAHTGSPGAPRMLVGYSMGAAVALALAALAPPDRLILLAPHWRYADRRALVLPVAQLFMKSFQPFAKADFRKPDTRRMFAELAPSADLDDPAVQERLRKQTTIPVRSLNEVRRIGNQAMRGIRMLPDQLPILIVQGRDDQTTLPANSRYLARKLGSRANYQEVAGGHLLIEPASPGWTETRDLVLEHATGGPVIQQ